MEYLSPKLDIVFKKMFGDINNADMLRSLIGAFLDVDTSGRFELSNTEITPEELELKFSRLDLSISTDNSEVDVEVQVLNTLDYVDRCLYYWASRYASTVKRGERYDTSRRTLSLNILDFNLFDCANFNTNFTFYDVENKVRLSDKAGISFIELPKVRLKDLSSEQIRNDERIAWAAFFNSKREEDFDMLNETTTNTSVQKAVTVIKQLSADERVRLEAKKREDALFNEQSATQAHYDAGYRAAEAESAKKIAEAKAQVDILTEQLKAMGMSDDQIEQLINKHQ